MLGFTKEKAAVFGNQSVLFLCWLFRNYRLEFLVASILAGLSYYMNVIWFLFFLLSMGYLVYLALKAIFLMIKCGVVRKLAVAGKLLKTFLRIASVLFVLWAGDLGVKDTHDQIVKDTKPMIDKIEEYKLSHGSYPVELDLVWPKDKPIRCAYSRTPIYIPDENAGSYLLVCLGPMVFSSTRYDSKTGLWENYNADAQVAYKRSQTNADDTH